MKQLVFGVLCSALAPSLSTAQLISSRVDTVTRGRPDASRLDPVVLTYIATLRQGTDSARSLGERSVQLSRTTYAGQQAWEIVETHGAGANASVDTLVTDYETLTPFHWGATQQMPTSGSIAAAARVVIEFRADSMIGVISAPSGRRTIVAPMPGGAFLTASQTETALRALPIGAGWQDSVAVVVTDLAKTTIVSGSLAVTGDEQLITTAGTYDCWAVTLSTDVGQTKYWVAKADRIVVQISQVLPESGDVLQYTLTRVSHSSSQPLRRRSKKYH
jgi:hypothetical protein